MMIGNNDRQTIREKPRRHLARRADPIPRRRPQQRPRPRRQSRRRRRPGAATPAVGRRAQNLPPEQARQALQTVGIPQRSGSSPIFGASTRPLLLSERRRSGDVGRAAVQRNTKASADSSYLSGSTVAGRKAGIVYVDIWDGFRRRGGPLLAAGTGLRRADPPPALGRRRLFHEIRCSQARPLRRPRNPAHRQPGHAGCAALPADSAPQASDAKAGRPAQLQRPGR